jgi:pre-mRNA-splicing factor CWC22
LGEDLVDELEGRAPEGGEEDEEEEDEDEGVAVTTETAAGGTQAIRDDTETDLLNLRKTIYLTIMSSVDFNECAHKMTKVKLRVNKSFPLISHFFRKVKKSRSAIWSLNVVIKRELI